MHTISALLLQLIQTSAHDVRIEANKLQRARQQQQTFRRGESSMSIGESTGSGKESFLDEIDWDVRYCSLFSEFPRSDLSILVGDRRI
jgi:cohesin loading factor subunit SCC2